MGSVPNSMCEAQTHYMDGLPRTGCPFRAKFRVEWIGHGLNPDEPGWTEVQPRTARVCGVHLHKCRGFGSLPPPTVRPLLMFTKAYA